MQSLKWMASPNYRICSRSFVKLRWLRFWCKPSFALNSWQCCGRPSRSNVESFCCKRTWKMPHFWPNVVRLVPFVMKRWMVMLMYLACPVDIAFIKHVWPNGWFMEAWGALCVIMRLGGRTARTTEVGWKKMRRPDSGNSGQKSWKNLYKKAAYSDGIVSVCSLHGAILIYFWIYFCCCRSSGITREPTASTFPSVFSLLGPSSSQRGTQESLCPSFFQAPNRKDWHVRHVAVSRPEGKLWEFLQKQKQKFGCFCREVWWIRFASW